MTVFIGVIECGVKSFYCTYFIDAPVWRLARTCSATTRRPCWCACSFRPASSDGGSARPSAWRRARCSSTCTRISGSALASASSSRPRLAPRPPAASAAPSSTASEDQQQPHSTHARSRNAAASTGAERERQQSATASEIHEVDSEPCSTTQLWLHNTSSGSLRSQSSQKATHHFS